nr:MAG TPA: Nuclease [Bacteriophage sp.]
MTKNGVPDILACINGYFVAIEVKAQNGKPSELQKYNVARINSMANGYAVILYPDQFQMFKDMIRALNAERIIQARALVATINERSF